MSLLLVPWLAFAPARAEPDVLPLERLRIYETGVAYFERHGRVSSSDPTTLPVPAGHLDDALETLVMIDGDAQTKIRSIAFASTVSEEMARAMAGLPEDPDSPLDFSTLLQSLEGLPVQIRLGKSLVEGRLIEVQGPFHPTPPIGADESVKQAFAQTEPFHQLLLVDEDGAIRKLSSQEVTSIRPAQEGSRTRLQVAAQTLSSQRAQARQSLSVRVEGRGERHASRPSSSAPKRPSRGWSSAPRRCTRISIDSARRCTRSSRRWLPDLYGRSKLAAKDGSPISTSWALRADSGCCSGCSLS